MRQFSNLCALLTVSGLIIATGVAGCGKSESGDTSQPDSQGHDEHDGHDHGTSDPDVGAEDDHALDARSLGEIEIAGVTLDVSLAGELSPGGEAHVEIKRLAGPAPAALRFWIGDESATGSVKVKADAHDDHFHGESTVPTGVGTDLDLWIELELSDGSRHRDRIALK